MTSTPEAVPMSPERNAAEIRKAGAEAIKAVAEAKKAEAEARQADMATALVEIDLLRKQREEKELLAQNKYHHVYHFASPVSDTSVKSCMQQLDIWRRNDGPVNIEIVFNSPGGSVIDGMALFDYLQMLRADGHTITTVALGMAASMAGILLQAGDVRVMGEECPVPDQLVLMQDLSWTRAGDLGPGDRILGFDSTRPAVGYRSWRPTVVEAVGRTVRPCYEVRLADGTVAVASERHPWLTSGTFGNSRGKWVESRNLNYRAHQSSLKHLLNVVRPLPSWDAGWMAGILDGEGCLYGKPGSQNLRIGVVQVEGLILNEIKRWLDVHEFRYYAHRKDATERHQARESLVVLGGLEETIRLLSLTRPKRLLAKFAEAIDDFRLTGPWVPVDYAKPIGVEEVVQIKTSTGTYVGDGIAMHNSYLLIHEISTQTMGKIGEIEDDVAFIKKIQDRVLDIFAARSHLTKATIRKKWQRRDWWLTSSEALKAGFVDKVR